MGEEVKTVFQQLDDVTKHFNETKSRLDELEKTLSERRRQIEEEVKAKSEEVKWSRFKPEFLNNFIEEPYIVEPARVGEGGKVLEWRVYVPKMVEFSVGRLERATHSYNVYAVNQYMRWFAEIPDELLTRFPKLEVNLQVHDGLLTSPAEDTEQTWAKYRQFLLKTEGPGMLRIKKGSEWELIAQILEDGGLPFAPMEVDPADWRPRIKNGFSAHPEWTMRDYQLEADERFKEYGAVGIYWPFGCFDLETEILTLNGWKRYQDLAYSDLFATLYPQTQQLEYQHPTKIFSYPYDGEMVYFDSQRVNLLVTPDHRMYVADTWSHQKGKRPVFSIRYAQTVLGKMLRFVKNAYWTGIEAEFFTLDAIEIDRKKYRYVVEAKRIPMKEFLRFFGLWVADGCTCYGKGNYKIEIRSRNNDHLNEMANLLSGWGFNPAVVSNERITIRSKQLYTYLAQFGKAPDKYIPKEFKELGKEYLIELLNGYLLGDGTHELSGVLRCNTVSPRLRDDLQEIALKLGCSADYATRTHKGDPANSKVNGKWIKRPAPHNIYRITIVRTQNTPLVKNNSSKLQKYAGQVWCVTVPNGIIYVRRHGKAVWCGNCGKSEYGLDLCDRLKGPKLIIGSTLSLKEQWLERLQALLSDRAGECHVVVYQSQREIDELVAKYKQFTLVIFDECHHLPAKTFMRLSTIPTKYRLGLTGSPYREDGHINYIMALTGYPLGLAWSKFVTEGIISLAQIQVHVVSKPQHKLVLLDQLLKRDLGKTMIFCDSLDLGDSIARKYGYPWIHGETRNRLDAIRKNETVVISRVGDEGISIPELDTIIEIDFLHGSRMQSLQRAGRLSHRAIQPDKEPAVHHILMTEEEVDKYGKRILAFYDKGFHVEWLYGI